jgi:DNA polymerase III epsilon subunit-like protein
MYFIFDLETSGLPRSTVMSSSTTRRSASQSSRTFRSLDAYDSCRIVSMAWIVLDQNFEEIERYYSVVKPKGFEIPQDAVDIHGITNEIAKETGEDIEILICLLTSAIYTNDCTTLVAHNISFDFNALLSEMYRINYKDIINKFFSMERFCTMWKGRKHFELNKAPKLVELYKLCTFKELQGAHNALHDTEACAECFKIISKP